MSNLKTVLGPMRIPFLLLTPACVLLGVATAFRATGHLNVFYTILTFLGAISAHISVNAFNEYFDFKSGLDFKTKRTPFSGGSGTLPANPTASRYALATAIATLIITALVGIYFIIVRGIFLLPLGLAGLGLVYFYTTWFTHNPLLCLIAPGLGFGPLMVMGTHFVLTGSYSWQAFVISLIPFFLVSDLLLLNQFPDVKADKEVGRNHLPIAIGIKRSSLIYAAFLLLAYLVVLIGVCVGSLPRLSLLGLFTVPVAIATSHGAFKHGENIPRLIPFMGLNVLVVILTPVLVAIGLFFT